MTDSRTPSRLFLRPLWLAVISSAALVTCVPGTISDHCPDGLMLAGECYPFDCPDRECLEDEVCLQESCVEIACLEVVCGQDQACAGGDCYPEDCQWRTCPGLGEVCVDDDCLQVNCVGVECPSGQRCASGSCYPIDCETKNCPGYGEVCIDGACVERTCVGVDCPSGQRCAGGYCYPEDCSEVGCFGEGEVCIDGICQRRACAGVECQDGFRCANGWCYPEDCDDFACADPYEVCHQGECLHADCVGVQCPPGARCSRGECLPLDCVQQGQGCAPAEVCLDGICIPEDCVFIDCPAGESCAVDLNCYPENCQNMACPDFQLCVDSECVDQLCVGVQCPLGQVCAGGNCYETDCPSQPCGPGEICENDVCIPEECAGGRCCPAASCTLNSQCLTEVCQGVTYTCLYNPQAGMTVWSDAGDSCNDSHSCTLDDVCSAGTCQGEPVQCDSGETCVLGQCRCGSTGPNCHGEEVCCGSGCYDLNTSGDHCGMCNSECLIPNASESCLNGECQLVTCEALFDNCDGIDDNGCEVSLETLTDCGACGVVCDRPNATASCEGGTCIIAQCDDGLGNCDGQDQNGCETPLNTLSNCGACDESCSPAHAVASCSTGTCQIQSCQGLWADCDGQVQNGCETPLDTLTDCGACGQSCSPAHAVGNCATGTCQIQSCQGLWDDCDGQAQNGCETAINTLSDCGACGQSCSPAHAVGSCATGTCQIQSCQGLWDDCDGQAQNGCETALNTLTDCGACGQSCSPAHAVGSCATGTCRIQSCQGLWDDCDGQVQNGCETPLDSLSDCGSCGTICSRPNAAATCAGGTCATAACTTDFYDANGNDLDGCECQDLGDAPNGCAVSEDVGFINAVATQVTRSGVLVHRAGHRTDDDCFFVTYQRPPPGDGTFRVRFDPDPGNLKMDIWRGDCVTVECDESSVFETTCLSQGGPCQAGNSSSFLVCVHAAAGQDNLCQPYTLQFEFTP